MVNDPWGPPPRKPSPGQTSQPERSDAAGDFYSELMALVARCREDPSLLHALVFRPESVLNELPFLSENAKRQILGVAPTEVTGYLLGLVGGGAPGPMHVRQAAYDVISPCCQYTFCKEDSICEETIPVCDDGSTGCHDQASVAICAIAMMSQACNQACTAACNSAGGCTGCTNACTVACVTHGGGCTGCTDKGCSVACASAGGTCAMDSNDRGRIAPTLGARAPGRPLGFFVVVPARPDLAAPRFRRFRI